MKNYTQVRPQHSESSGMLSCSHLVSLVVSKIVGQPLVFCAGPELRPDGGSQLGSLAGSLVPHQNLRILFAGSGLPYVDP